MAGLELLNYRNTLLQQVKVSSSANMNYQNLQFLKLTSNILSIGQILIIPGTKDYANYTVEKGDTLWNIANKYGVTVNDIMKANNLTSSTLSIGQELIIPTK